MKDLLSIGFKDLRELCNDIEEESFNALVLVATAHRDDATSPHGKPKSDDPYTHVNVIGNKTFNPLNNCHEMNMFSIFPTFPKCVCEQNSIFACRGRRWRTSAFPLSPKP